MRTCGGIAGRAFRVVSGCGRLRFPRRASFVTSDANEPLHRPVAFATHVLPAVVYASALFYGGLVRIGTLPQVGFVATDKLLHALAFGGLALLTARALHWHRADSPLRRKLVLGGAGSSLLGLLLELCQALTAYRSADVWDWVADSVGALLAIGLARALFTWAPRRAHG